MAKENYNFPSSHNIGDTVDFIPMARHFERLEIDQEIYTGIIVSIRFTKAKVFYWIVDDYYGFMFDDVDSAKVGTEEELKQYVFNNN